MKNKSLIRKSGEAIFYAIIFFAIQIIVMAVVGMVESAIARGSMQTTSGSVALSAGEISTNGIIISGIVSSLITILLFTKAKWTLWSRDYLATRPWDVVIWVVVLGFGIIIPSMWLQEKLDVNMSDDMEKMFEDICRSPFGYLSIAIITPWAEEVVFRGAVLRKLLQIFSHQMHWIAIIISAIIFGVAHGNAAQGIHAFISGLLLGWMFYRTGSIIPGVAHHWANNTAAYVMYHVYHNPQSLTDIIGPGTRPLLLALLFSLCIFLPALYQLNQRMKYVADAEE